MKIINKYENLNTSVYARDSWLLNTPKWRWQRPLTNNLKKFISMSNNFYVQTKRYSIKYNYGVKVSQTFKEVINIGNILWKGAIGI